MKCNRVDALKKLRSAGVSKEAQKIVRDNFERVMGLMQDEDLRVGDDLGIQSPADVAAESEVDVYERDKKNFIGYLNLQVPMIKHPISLKNAETDKDKLAVPYNVRINIESFSPAKGIMYKFLDKNGRPHGKSYSIPISDSTVKLYNTAIESEFAKRGYETKVRHTDKVLSNNQLDTIKKLIKECK